MTMHVAAVVAVHFTMALVPLAPLTMNSTPPLPVEDRAVLALKSRTRIVKGRGARLAQDQLG